MPPGIDIFLKLEGGDALRKALRAKEKEFLRELATALPEEGYALMGSANAAAPRSSGTLAASSSVTSVVQEDQGRVRVAAAYTDPKAAAVHEGVHWGQHFETKHMKWFEHALHAFETGFFSRIGARLRRIVGGGA